MTMKQAIEKTCYTDEEKALFRAVIRQIGSWPDVWDCPMNYRDASAGVSGFIYYGDTEPFAKRQKANIYAAILAFEREMGEVVQEREPGESTDDSFGHFSLNWLAWFALEHIIDKVVSLKDE